MKLTEHEHLCSFHVTSLESVGFNGCMIEMGMNIKDGVASLLLVATQRFDACQILSNSCIYIISMEDTGTVNRCMHSSNKST